MVVSGCGEVIKDLPSFLETRMAFVIFMLVFSRMTLTTNKEYFVYIVVDKNQSKVLV
jgi:hypothetical protein